MSDIKLKIGTELDLSGIQSDLKNIRALEKDTQLKIKIDDSQFNKLNASFKGVKSKIENQTIKPKIEMQTANNEITNFAKKWKVSVSEMKKLMAESLKGTGKQQDVALDQMFGGLSAKSFEKFNSELKKQSNIAKTELKNIRDYFKEPITGQPKSFKFEGDMANFEHLKRELSSIIKLNKETGASFDSYRSEMVNMGIIDKNVTHTADAIERLASTVAKLKSTTAGDFELSGITKDEYITSFNSELSEVLAKVSQLESQSKGVDLSKPMVTATEMTKLHSQALKENIRMNEQMATGMAKAEQKSRSEMEKTAQMQAKFINKSKDSQYKEINNAHAQALKENIRMNEQMASSFAKAEKRKRDEIRKTEIAQAKAINKNMDSQYKEIEKAHAQALKENERFDNQSLKGNSNGLSNTFGKMAEYAAKTLVLYKGLQELRKGVQTVIELDTAMTNLKKVDESITNSNMGAFIQDMNQLAISVGHSTTAAIDATTEFRKLGYSIKESQELTKQALVYSNVGDIGIEEATDSIVATLKGFNLEASQTGDIIDKFNHIGNNFAVSTGDIGEGLKRSASSLHEAGNTIDQSIGLLVGGNATVQDIEKVGTSLKTVSMRLRGIKDDNGELVPKLKETVKELAGVDIMKDENTFKSTYDILTEIATVWDDLTDVKRASLLETIAGKQHGNTIASLLGDIENVKKVMEESANNSVGSAMKEQEAYMDSAQAKINTLKETWVEFWASTLDSGQAKGIIDFLTKVSSGFGNLVNEAGAVSAVFVPLTLALLRFTDKGKEMLFLGSGAFNPWVVGATAALTAIGVLAKAYSDHQKEVKKQAEELNDFYANYETNEKKNQESLKYLKANGAEYDRLNEKLGATRDLTNLTKEEQARYHQLVQEMMDNGSLEGYYDAAGNAMSNYKDNIKELIALKEKELELDKLKLIADKDEQLKNLKKKEDKINKKYAGKEQEASDLMMQIEYAKDNGASELIIRDLEQKLSKVQVGLVPKEAELDALKAEVIQTVKAIEYNAVKDLGLGENITKNMDSVYKHLFDNNDLMEAERKSEELIYSMADKIGKLKTVFSESGNVDAGILKEYANELSQAGVGADLVTKQIGTMGYTIQGSDDKLNLMNKSIAEFSEKGSLSKGTIDELVKLYGNLGVKADMSGSQILGLIAKQDVFAASLIASENAFKGMNTAQQSSLDSLKNSQDKITSKNVGSVVEGIKKAKADALNEANTLKTELESSLKELKPVLSPEAFAEYKAAIEEQVKQVEKSANSIELEGFNTLIAKSLNDDGSFGKYTQNIINEIEKINGLKFNPDIQKFELKAEVEGVEKVEEITEKVEKLDEAIKKETPAKVYTLEEDGFEGLIDKTKDLEGVWAIDPKTREYVFVETGADGVIDAKTLADLGWSYDPETKIYKSLTDGTEIVINDSGAIQSAWGSIENDDKTFTTHMEGTQTVESEVWRQKSAWDKIKDSTKTLTTKVVTVFDKVFGSNNNNNNSGGNYTDYKYTGTKSFMPNGFATGTLPTKYGFGLAYVGELGQELMVNPDNTIEFTSNKPELRNLEKGTQIFNHKDTELLLKGKASLPIENFDRSKMKSGTMVNQALKQEVPSFAKGTPKPKPNPMPNPNNIRGYGPAGTNSKSKASNSSKTSKEKITKDDYKAEYDRYLKYESALERINNQLTILKHKEELIFNDSQIIKSQQDRLKFYKDQQKLVHDSAEEMRRERNELQNTLSKSGFKFSGKGDTAIITNLQAIKGKSQETEETLKRFYELQDKEIPSKQNLWFEYAKSIKEATAEVGKYMSVDSRENYVKNEIDFLKTKGDSLKADEEILKNKIDQIKQTKRLQNVLHDYANEYRKEREDIRKTLTNEGVKIFGEGDSALIFNFDQFEGKSAKALELAERFNELGSLRSDKGNEWWDLQNDVISIIQSKIDTLKELGDELDEFTNDRVKQEAELAKQLESAKFEYKIEMIVLESESFDKTVLLMKDKLDFLHEDDFGGRIDVVGDMFKSSSDRTRQLANEMDRLRSITPKNTQEAEKLVSTMASVQSQMKASATETREFERQLDLLKLDDLSKPFKDVNEQLEKQLNQIDNNLQLLQQGVLVDDLSLDMLLPIPDFGDVFLDMRSEAEKEFDAQKDIEKQIQDLKRQSLEMQLQESEKYYNEEMRKLEDHYQELTLKIAEANAEIAQLRGYANPEQVKEVDNVQSEIQANIDRNNELKRKREEESDNKLSKNKVKEYASRLGDLFDKWLNPEQQAQENHVSSVQNIMTGFLSDLQHNYSNAWGGIVGTVKSSVGSIIDSVNQVNSAVSSVKAPNVIYDVSKKNKENGNNGNSSVVTSGGKLTGIYESNGSIRNPTQSEMDDYNNKNQKDKKKESELTQLEWNNIRTDHIVDMMSNWKPEDRVKYANLATRRENTKRDSEEYKSISDEFQLVVDEMNKKYGHNSQTWNYGEYAKNVIDSQGFYLSDIKQMDDYQNGKLGTKEEYVKENTISSKNEEHEKRQKQNSLVSMSEDFKVEYDKYSEDREAKMKEISDSQDRLLEGLIPEDEISEFREKLLNKIDEQLSIDTEMSSKLKIDILGQQKDNSQEYLNELKSEYDNAVSSGKVDLSKEIYQRYNDELQNFNRINQAINQAIKERYDMQFALMDKQYAKEEKNQSFLDKESKLAEIKDPKNYDKQKIIQESKLESENKINKLIQDDIVKLTQQRDLLKVGSYEWNILNSKVEGFNSKLQDSNISIEEIKKEIANVDFESAISSANKFEKIIGNLQEKLSFITEFNGIDLDSIFNINVDIVKNTESQLNSIRDSIMSENKLIEQSIKDGDAETAQYRLENIEKLYDEEQKLIMQLANSKKEMYKTEFDQRYKNIENIVFGGKSEEDVSRQLDLDKKALEDKKEQLDTYLTGLEKEYTLEKLKKDVNELNNEELNESYQLMLKSEKLNRDELETFKKKLNIKQLEQKLDNLRNQKTIQQLQQQDDGTWDFVYVADQDAIDETADQLMDARVDLEKWNKDMDIKEREKVLNNRSEELEEQKKYLAEVRTVMDNALNGQYKSQEEFTNAMNLLGNKLGIDYKGAWTEIVRTQMFKNNELSGEFLILKTRYGELKDSMISLSQEMSESISKSLDKIKISAVSVIESIESLLSKQKDVESSKTPSIQPSGGGGGAGGRDQHSGSSEGDYRVWNENNTGYTDYNSKGDVIGGGILGTQGYGDRNPETVYSKDEWDKKNKFKRGGETSSTGMHWLDGEVGKPERVLSAEQTVGFNKLIDNLPNILENIKQIQLTKLQVPNVLNNIAKSITGKGEQKTEHHYHIDKIEVPNVTNSSGVENLINGLQAKTIQYSKRG